MMHTSVFTCQQGDQYAQRMTELLSDDEMASWVTWKRATDSVMRGVAADILDATGLSSADFSVLTRLVEDGAGSLRQQRLADDLQWERSRLSRQLTRMETRGLLIRDATGLERWITVTADGRRIVKKARIVHAASVRRHLLDLVGADEAPGFWLAARRLATGAVPD